MALDIELKITNKWLYAIALLSVLVSIATAARFTGPIPDPGHGGDRITVNISGSEKDLQQALDDGDFGSAVSAQMQVRSVGSAGCFSAGESHFCDFNVVAGTVSCDSSKITSDEFDRSATWPDTTGAIVMGGLSGAHYWQGRVANQAAGTWRSTASAVSSTTIRVTLQWIGVFLASPCHSGDARAEAIAIKT